jgi:NADP-dependent alcohol dehydrogenase
LAQYGKRVWGINEGYTDAVAKTAIIKTEDFFKSLKIDIKLSDYTDDYKGTAEKIAKRFTERGWLGLGEHKTLAPADVEKIVEMSY